jgi:hypothetical protein
MALDHVHAFDQHSTLGGEDAEDLALLAAILAGDDYHRIAFLHVYFGLQPKRLLPPTALPVPER